jgi:nucleoside-diphosphate-sugar epimerase
MIRVTLIGARGFVGSAFASHIAGLEGYELVEVTRCNYEQAAGVSSDVVIDASCNSRKYLATDRPRQDFELSVAHRLRTLVDFHAGLQVHISSVDVYGDLGSPDATKEESEPNLETISHYGLHKLLAEHLVRHYSSNWLILRLAGMVGPGLRKNPVFDILSGNALRIHPDSQYQYMATDDVARIGWTLIERCPHREIFNICGQGLISPREIASIAGRELNFDDSAAKDKPRIVDIYTGKIGQIVSLPRTHETVARFVKAHLCQAAESDEDQAEALSAYSNSYSRTLPSKILNGFDGAR